MPDSPYHTTLSFESSEQELHYIEKPNPGKPVLFFIHGAPGSSSSHQTYLNMDTLLQDFHMLSVDRPGYGTKAVGCDMIPLPIQSQRIAQLLNRFDKNRAVILVAHSYGGSVALHLAMMYPHRIHGILLMAPLMDPSLEIRGRWRLWLRKPWLKWMIPRSLYVTNEEILALQYELCAMDSLYTKLSMPVYYIHGDADILVPIETKRYAQRKLRHLPLTMRVLKRVNHFILWTHQQEVLCGIYHLRSTLHTKVNEK